MMLAMTRLSSYLDRGRRAYVDSVAMLREYRTRNPRVTAPPVADTGADRLFPPGEHHRAEQVYEGGLRAHPHLSDRESRLNELVEYFGFDVAQKAPYCTPWFYWDDPRRPRYVQEQLGLEPMTFGILHMYTLFNRLDPDRHDMYYVYDGLLSQLERLGGPGELAVLDFGSGMGQTGLSFAVAGYDTVFVDVVDQYLDYVRFLARIRDLDPTFVQSPGEQDFYDTAGDGRRYGLIVEWSTFEHVRDSIGALSQVLGGLVPGGMFVTTTFCKDWTAEEIEHYRRDSFEEEIAEQYLSGEADTWLRERFDVLSPRNTIAKVLVKKG
jgi:SAM-dependent methyltransferase